MQTLVLSLVVLFGFGPIAALAAPGAAEPQFQLPAAVRMALPDCACDTDRAELRAEYDRIASADSVDAARDRALSHTRGAQRALRGARWIAPESEGLRVAEARLATYEQRVNASGSPGEAAAEFGELVQLASLSGTHASDVDVQVGKGGKCDYSRGEIIAIVIGFVLGILPGIILLILLC